MRSFNTTMFDDLVLMVGVLLLLKTGVVIYSLFTGDAVSYMDMAEVSLWWGFIAGFALAKLPALRKSEDKE